MALIGAAVPILNAGIMSVGVAYTLQILEQRKAHPSHAAVILSMEGGFATFGGWGSLSEGLTLRGLAGCGLMLAGVLHAQWNQSKNQPISAATLPEQGGYR